MSVESGSITLRRFFIKGRSKASSDPLWIENLNANAFEGKKLGPEEDNFGWAVLGNELNTVFNIENTINGKFITFSLRRDNKKIQRTLLNLRVKERILERMKESETDTLPQQQKAEIRAEVIDELSKETVPNIQIIQIVVDTARKEVYATCTSDKLVETFITLYDKTFNVTLLEANSVSSAQNLVEPDVFEEMLDNPGIELVKGLEVHPEFENGPESKLGCGFLTWLFFYLQHGDNTWKGSNVGEFGIVVDDYLLFEGEALGTKQTLLNKGRVTNCAELGTVLRIGKQVAKVKLQFARGEIIIKEDEEDDKHMRDIENWSFTIDKAKFDLSALKVPKFSEGNRAARTLGRLNYLVEAFEILDDLFLTYLELRYSKKWASTIKEIRNWIQLIQ
jgi:hypothetical protein